LARESSAGLTLIELVVATALVSLIVVALVRLVDTSLSVWSGTESRREVLEHATTVTELVTQDLRALEGGPRGDLLCDWGAHDLDGDGFAGLFLPRLRFVRRMSAAELSRAGLAGPGGGEDPAPVGQVGSGALLEVVWALTPGGSSTGTVSRLWRGERLVDERRAGESFFAPGFFDARGRAPDGLLTEASDSVLWLGPLFASQTSDLSDEWTAGEDVGDCSVAWDARTAGRLDEGLTALNRPAAGTPRAKALPVLPRRVRIEVEIERSSDLRRRTALRDVVTPEGTTLVVRDGRHVPRAGAFLLIDEEWMELRHVAGERLTVVRGARGSRSTEHAPGALVHYGQRTVREVRIDAFREDWNL
jgi:hypothetical protein